MAWLPLESNPEVMNKFLNLLGVPKKWNMVDVYGLDPEVLAWVPKPVLAVILLFPCSQKFYDYSSAQEERLKKEGQTVDKGVYYLKQIVSNACGTVALIHSVANNQEQLQLEDGPFKEMLDKSVDMSPEERGELLQKTCGKIVETHEELAQEGQSKMVAPNEVNHHFVAFVHRNGCLYELDGRKAFPINHGATTETTLLEDAVRVCSKEFIALDKDDVNFTLMALTAKSEDDN